jgi:hypothetical protein
MRFEVGFAAKANIRGRFAIPSRIDPAGILIAYCERPTRSLWLPDIAIAPKSLGGPSLMKSSGDGTWFKSHVPPPLIWRGLHVKISLGNSAKGEVL